MKRRPAVGTRVMRGYGRKDYVDYGEVGVVIAHNDETFMGSPTFSMRLDDYQPFARAMWRKGPEDHGHGGLVHEALHAGEVEPLARAYEENARRFRRIAKNWQAMADVVKSGDPR